MYNVTSFNFNQHDYKIPLAFFIYCAISYLTVYIFLKFINLDTLHFYNLNLIT